MAERLEAYIRLMSERGMTISFPSSCRSVSEVGVWLPMTPSLMPPETLFHNISFVFLCNGLARDQDVAKQHRRRTIANCSKVWPDFCSDAIQFVTLRANFLKHSLATNAISVHVKRSLVPLDDGIAFSRFLVQNRARRVTDLGIAVHQQSSLL